MTMELGIFLRWFTLVCSYISDVFLCHHAQSYLGFAFALCCVVDLESCLLSCPGSSVGRALCLGGRVSWESHLPPFSLKRVLSCWCCDALALFPLSCDAAIYIFSEIFKEQRLECNSPGVGPGPPGPW